MYQRCVIEPIGSSERQMLWSSDAGGTSIDLQRNRTLAAHASGLPRWIDRRHEHNARASRVACKNSDCKRRKWQVCARQARDVFPYELAGESLFSRFVPSVCVANAILFIDCVHKMDFYRSRTFGNVLTAGDGLLRFVRGWLSCESCSSAPPFVSSPKT